MNNNDQSNRSRLALAGERSLQSTFDREKELGLISNQSPLLHTNKEKVIDSSTRKLMIKLTLPRLRKMQALVRGFLVRRKVYPGKLEEYVLAKSVLAVIISNIVYKEASETILENITYLKYAPNAQELMLGEEKILENEVCNCIIKRVFEKELGPVVELAVAEYAKLITRPKITFGFNLRDPIELLLFDTINNFVGMNYKEIARESIQECVDETRELRIIDEWIDKYDMIQKSLEIVVNEALNESIGEYIIDNMFNKISSEAAEVVTRIVFDEEVESRKNKAYLDIENKMIEWMLQEASLKAILTLGHSITK